MKFRSYLPSLCALGLLLLPVLAGAETPIREYLLVDDIPFIKDPGTKDLASYLQAIFKLGLGLAVTFAVFMLVLNGIRYMVSDITHEKEKARGGMQNAIIGLVIVFGSVLILNTINPRLTEFGLTDSIKRAVDAIKKGQAAAPRPPLDGSGAPWPSDLNEQNRLRSGGVVVKEPECTKTGQRDCTSVAGLDQAAIAKLINLKTACNCLVTVTGGTEHWLHSSHNDNRTVDLSANSALNTYLGGAGAKCGDTRTKDGATYRWEDTSCSWAVTGTHWHVSY